MTQQVKNPPAMQATQEVQVQFLDWEHPLEGEMATHSSILAWKIPWTEEPGGLESKGWQRVGHDWAQVWVWTAKDLFEDELKHTGVEHCRLCVLLYQGKFLLGVHLLKCTMNSVWMSWGPQVWPASPGPHSYLNQVRAATSLCFREPHADFTCHRQHPGLRPVCKGSPGELEDSGYWGTFPTHLESLREPGYLNQFPGVGSVVEKAPQVSWSSAPLLV